MKILDIKTSITYLTFSAISIFTGLHAQEIDSLLRLSEHYRTVNPDSAVNFARQALAKVDAVNQPDIVARVYFSLGYAYYNRNDFELALEHFNKSLMLAEQLDNIQLQALVHNRIGNVYQLKSYYNQAIDKYKKALDYNYKIGNKVEIARTLVNIGTVFAITGYFSIALQYMLDALEIFEQSGETEGMAWTSLSISRLFSRLEINERALQYAENALNHYRRLSNQTGITLAQTELANIYYHTGMHDKALDLLEKIVDENSRTRNIHAQAANYLLIGIIYFDKKQYGQSEHYLNLSQHLKQQVNDSIDMAKLNRYMGELELQKGNFAKGVTLLNKALNDAQKQKITTDLRDIYHSLSNAERRKGNYLKAYEYFTNYSALKDSVNASQIAKLEMQYDFEKREKEQELISRQRDAMQQARLERQRMATLLISIALVLSLALAAVVFKFYREKKRTNQILIQQNTEILRQKNEIENQKQEIEAQRDLAERQRDQIAEQQKQITDSIKYASRIQAAVLPRNQQISTLLRDHFVFYQPKNIVSGDFFWVTKLTDGRVAIAAADCTGHGVPGAFMSMLGITLLKELTATQHFENAADILSRLRRLVIASLNPAETDNDSHDGMDMGMLIIDRKKMEAHYAGAYFPLLIIRDSSLQAPPKHSKPITANGKTLYEIKGDKMPIGHHIIEEQMFTNHVLAIFENDQFYMLSDGYSDQFGGPKNSKFMMVNLKKLLLDIHHLPLNTQQGILQEKFYEFKGNEKQVDDILIMGFRI
ncbi:MAG TPA: tetratricopeptide repeat protein [Bacteroidales bacterium]|nr:tetratricopeptide repeat protein [Bacteroidales bacterium]